MSEKPKNIVTFKDNRDFYDELHNLINNYMYNTQGKLDKKRYFEVVGAIHQTTMYLDYQLGGWFNHE